jgi:hypothetical protein
MDDAVRLLGFTPQTISRMVRRGELMGKKIAGRWRFGIAAIENMMAAGYAEKAGSVPPTGDVQWVEGQTDSISGKVATCGTSPSSLAAASSLDALLGRLTGKKRA